jgi:hypothetical protein
MHPVFFSVGSFGLPATASLRPGSVCPSPAIRSYLIALHLLAFALIFGPSSATRPSVDRACFQSDLQHLLKHPGQRLRMDLSEIGDGTEVGLIARRQDSETDVPHQPLLDPARTEDPYAITVDKHFGHH